MKKPEFTEVQVIFALRQTGGRANAQIKVVAKSKIEILPNSTLESGMYYIDNFDCNGLDQFSQ